MRLVICLTALPILARATRANADDFAWPWDQDKNHAKPHHFHLSNMMSTHTRTASHDFGASWDSSSFGDDSTQSADTGDFMDQYISETGQKPMKITDDSSKPAPKQDDVPDMATIFSEDNAPKKPESSSFDSDSHSASSESTAAFASDMTNMFGASGFDAPARAPAHAAPAVDTSSDSASGWPWTGFNKRRSDMEGHSKRSMWDTDNSNADSSSSGGSSSNSIADSSASDSFSKMFSSWSGGDYKSNNEGTTSLGSDVSMPQKAPQQDSMDSRPADSPIEGPTQRESSLSGASAQDQVVDVRLSSELQQSLLQARNAESKMLSRFRGASN